MISIQVAPSRHGARFSHAHLQQADDGLQRRYGDDRNGEQPQPFSKAVGDVCHQKENRAIGKDPHQVTHRCRRQGTGGDGGRMSCEGPQSVMNFHAGR